MDVRSTPAVQQTVQNAKKTINSSPSKAPKNSVLKSQKVKIARNTTQALGVTLWRARPAKAGSLWARIRTILMIKSAWSPYLWPTAWNMTLTHLSVTQLCSAPSAPRIISLPLNLFAKEGPIWMRDACLTLWIKMNVLFVMLFTTWMTIKNVSPSPKAFSDVRFTKIMRRVVNAKRIITLTTMNV